MTARSYITRLPRQEAWLTIPTTTTVEIPSAADLLALGIYLETGAIDLLDGLVGRRLIGPRHLQRWSVEDLGFRRGASFARVCQAAAERGLSPCDLMLGVALRLLHREQPEGEALRVASIEGPKLPVLRCRPWALMLGWDSAAAQQHWDPEHEFIFQLAS